MSEKFGGVPVPANDNEVLNGKVEKTPDWRDLKAAAPDQAERMFAEGISVFEQMTSREQIEHLQELVNSLGDDNDNRFVVEELARKVEGLKLALEYTERLKQLQAA